jgi:hypothetical protein
MIGCLTLALALLAAAPAQSAIIEAKDNAIEMSGPIETGDYEKFVATIANYPHRKIVSLSSGGGRAQDALYRVISVSSPRILAIICRSRTFSGCLAMINPDRPPSGTRVRDQSQ